MDNWLANIVDDVDNLHIEIVNLNDLSVEFYFIKSIDTPKYFKKIFKHLIFNHLVHYTYYEPT
jgi:hypothetical protein